MDTTGGGNQSPSGIKSGGGHEGQQVFCRNISSKRKSEENMGLLLSRMGILVAKNMEIAQVLLI